MKEVSHPVKIQPAKIILIHPKYKIFWYTSEFGIVFLGIVKIGVAKIGIAKIGIAKIGIIKIGIAKIGILKIRINILNNSLN